MAYEDFTIYSLHEDQAGPVTVDSATKVSWEGLRSRHFGSHLTKDKGVNHFSGDFTHQFEAYWFNVDGNCFPMFWFLANSVNDLKAILNASEDGTYLTAYQSGTLRLAVVENGSIDEDAWTGASTSTLYYITITRDDDGGANNTGQYVAYIRTGSHSGNLEDTLTMDASAGEQNDFRYVYGLCTLDDNAGGLTAVDGYTQNLDLNEAVAVEGQVITVIMSKLFIPFMWLRQGRETRRNFIKNTIASIFGVKKV